jgi:phenylalanyl-tRNA synthetase alpha chain
MANENQDLMMRIEEVSDEINQDLNEDTTGRALDKKYLRKNGILTDLLRSFDQVPKEDRPEFGRRVNELKEFLQEKIENYTETVERDAEIKEIDLTAPFGINTEEEKRPKLIAEPGHTNPLNIELKRILDILRRMGFEIYPSRQLDDDYHMFGSLNFPPDHPARDMWDTFWTEEGLTPPAHTSVMQNRVMKMKEPPIRAAMPGSVFRNEATDANHEFNLYQIEGVYIDEGISLANMLATIKTYLEEFYEAELDIKVNSGYFPFTEPSMEFLISCPFCRKTGCAVCGHSGWIELMGCGMIHPNVLKEGGIDPKKYSGFAWGFGLDRLVMIKYGIDDIRLLRSGNIDFLKQF